MKRLVSSLIVLGLVIAIPVSLADELILEFDPDEISPLSIEDSSGFETPETVEAESVNDSRRQQYIEGYQQLFRFSQNEIAGLEAVLFPLKEDIYSLDRQLQTLNLQMERIASQEQLVQRKIRGLKELDNKLRVREKLLALEMKDVLKKFEKIIVMYFRIKRQFVREDGSYNLLQLFSSVDSPADLLFQDILLQKIQDQFVRQMNEVYSRQKELDLILVQLDAISKQTLLYQERIVETASVLAQQTDFKKQLILEKAEEQDFFEKALGDAREEQIVIVARIRELSLNISPQEFEFLPDESLLWPVAPVLGISAYFQDEQYELRFGFEHNAIDIPTDQLTPIRAALSGQVIDVHDGGDAYSYLQLAHRDGYSTVYGHIYSFKVEEGELVDRGEVIALSGGAIGTKGAGRITTGPHLHFELLKSGVYVDPLEYLPETQ